MKIPWSGFVGSVLWRCVLAVSVLSMVACDQGLPASAAKQAGQAFYVARLSAPLDDELALYSEEFFQGHPRQQWREYLLHVQARLGALQSHELAKEQYDTRFSARFYILEYRTVYEKGKAWERLTFVNPVGEQSLKLLAHQIKSEGL